MMKKQLQINQTVIKESYKNQKDTEKQNLELLRSCQKMVQIAEEQRTQMEIYKENAITLGRKIDKLEQRMKDIERAIEKYPDFKDYIAGYNCGGYHD